MNATRVVELEIKDFRLFPKDEAQDMAVARILKVMELADSADDPEVCRDIAKIYLEVADLLSRMDRNGGEE